LAIQLYRPFSNEEEEAEIIDTLRSGWVGTGPKTAQFEREFAEYMNRHFAVGTTSCTAAMHIALSCCEVNDKGCEVITTALSWVATANVIAYTGAIPVFVDVDPDTLNIDPEALERAITLRTRAIIPVHLFGGPCDMAKINEIARKHNLFVIGDCAHAVEAEIDGKKVGSMGYIDCFSFWGAKSISTGEGGMLVTDDPEVDGLARSLRYFGLDQGKRDSAGHYQQSLLGYKYNMFDIQAAIGIHQLRRVEERWENRRYLAERYDTLLSPLSRYFRVLKHSDRIRHAYYMYPILLNSDRDRVATELRERGIATGIHFQALHLEPYYRKTYGYSETMFPIAEDAANRILSIPFWPEMAEWQQDQVVEALNDILR